MMLPRPGQASRAIRNVLANWAGYVVGAVLNFFLSPFVVHYLGPSQYGVWTLLVTLTAYLSLLDLGVRSAVTRYVARCHSQADHATAIRIVSTALVLFAGMAGVALLASVALGLTAPWVFNIPVEYRESTVIVTTLAGVSTGVALVSGVFGGVIVGVQRFDLICALDVGTALLRASLVLGVIVTGGGLVELAGIQLVSWIAGGILTAWVSLRIYPQLRLRPEWSWPHLRLIFSYGGYAFAAQLSTAVIDQSGVIVIGAFLPMAAVTVFAIASGLVDYVRALAGGIRTTLPPLASALEARGQGQELKDLMLSGARYCTMLVLPIATVFALRGSSFIGLWMGAEYGAPSGEVLAILALRLVFLGATGAVANVMLGAGRQRTVAGMFAAEAVVTVAAIMLLVRPFGVAGVAWGITAPGVAAGVLLWPWYASRSFGVGVRQYVISIWVLPVTAVSPFIAATWLVERLWPAPRLLVFCAQVVVLVPLALLGFWHVSLSDRERQRCLAMFGRAAANTRD
jgi:O-antigen/teichoic acid export membrane protein